MHDLDEREMTMAQSYGDALAAGNVGPMVGVFGFKGIANLLRDIPEPKRGAVARDLFSGRPADVQRALHVIAIECAEGPEQGR